MFRKDLRLWLILFVSALTAVFDFRIALGILLGLLFAWLHHKFLALRVDALIKAQRVGVLTYLGPILSLILLSLPILCSFLFPELFHWSGVLIGLLYHKMYLYIEAFIGGKKNGD